MRSPVRVWSVVALLAVLHFLLHLGLGLGWPVPDLLTVAVLVAAREVRTGTAAALGFTLGLLEDALSLLAFGANALVLTVVGTAGAATRDLFVGDSRLFLVSYLLVGTWGRNLLYWLVVGEGLREPFVQAILVEGTLGAVTATAAGVVALVLVGARAEARP
jgi:rod shape-determining protein MreD